LLNVHDMVMESIAKDLRIKTDKKIFEFIKSNWINIEDHMPDPSTYCEIIVEFEYKEIIFHECYKSIYSSDGRWVCCSGNCNFEYTRARIIKWRKI